MLKKFYISFHQELLSIYPDKKERDSLFFYAAEEILNSNKTQIRLFLLEPTFFLQKDKLTQLRNILKKLKKKIPIDYILEKKNFLELDFFVNKNVLIPRPETQELVSWVIKENLGKKNLNILDLGTGSGAIAVTLGYYLKNSNVHALDICPKALEVAKKNAAFYKLKITFYQTDILKNPLELSKLQFDLIISNPPYVRDCEKTLMHASVLENEPPVALFVSDKDPLIFYRKISNLAKNRLKSGGFLYFEINQYLHKEIIDLLRSMGYQSELRKDSYSNPRMVKAFFKK